VKIPAANDDPIALETLSAFLMEPRMRQITLASSAKAVLDHLTSPTGATFDCILLDVHILELEGIALMRRIANCRDTPVVGRNGLCETPCTDAALLPGAAGDITRPFDLNAMCALINNVDHLLLSRKRHALSALSDTDQSKPTLAQEKMDFHTPQLLQGIGGTVSPDALQHNVMLLSRSDPCCSNSFAFTLRESKMYSDDLQAEQSKLATEGVATAICDSPPEQQFLIAYAGNGAVVYPGVSAGVATHFVRKSAEQIMHALSTVQRTAKQAAIKYERLKTDFFQIRRSA
jgi:DNA-binding response OmpR family regulator